MIQEFLKSKGIGFYVTLAAAVLSLLSAILYVAYFAGSPEMNWVIFVLTLLAFFVAIALVALPILVPKLDYPFGNYAAPVILGANVLAIWLFILHGYALIARLIPGRADDFNIMMFGAGLVVCLIFFLLTAVTATVATFMKQSKNGEVES